MLRRPTVLATSWECLQPPLPMTLLQGDVTVIDDNDPHDRDPSLMENENTTVSHVLSNSGLQAWLQVAGSFFLFFNSWGIINTFGVFQTYYELTFGHTLSPSSISWIGSIQSFLLMFLGIIAGPLYDAGHFYMLIVAGTFLVVFGFMMTSLCSEYWQIMLAQALCIGIGTGCFNVPSIAILSQYFSTRRGLAIGLAASGSSFGGVVYPVLFRHFQPKIGFGWTTRILAVISLATCLFSLSVMRIRPAVRPRRPLVELAAFREIPYTLFCVAMFFGNIGFFGPLFYVQTYAIQTKIASENLSFYLLPLVNAASVPGRIVPGFLAGIVGPLNLLLSAATLTGVVALSWIGIHNTAGIVLFSLSYGFCTGGLVSLPATTLSSLTPDLTRLGTWIGMYSMICSIASLVGAPLSGALLGESQSYLGLQLFSGATMFLTGVLLLATRISKEGPKMRVKI